MIIDSTYKHTDNFLDVETYASRVMRDTTGLLRVGAFQSFQADFTTHIRHERYLRDKHDGSASEPVIFLM